jgi:hypothetical protein
MTSTVTIRFGEKDQKLRGWLSQFAASNDMSKVIKLACYLLSGLQADEGLLALLPEIQDRQAPSQPAKNISQATKKQETSQDILADIMQEIALLRESLVSQQGGEQSTSPTPMVDSRHRHEVQQPGQPVANTQHATWGNEQPSQPTTSSGLDMSPRRRGKSNPKLIRPHQKAADASVIDAEDARRRLLDSIKAYGKEFRRNG